MSDSIHEFKDKSLDDLVQYSFYYLFQSQQWYIYFCVCSRSINLKSAD